MLLTWGRAGGDWELCANDHRSNYLINNYFEKHKHVKSNETMFRRFCTKAEEGLPTSDFRLPTSDFRLKTSYLKLRSSDFTKCEHRISDF